MLKSLLKRLIIKLTRLAKKQYLPLETLADIDFHTIRTFAILVESHFRDHHLVKQYAELMNISPKTLSHIFNRHGSYSPLQVIQNRIILEAKRLIYFTDKSIKEIAYNLGFDETS